MLSFGPGASFLQASFHKWGLFLLPLSWAVLKNDFGGFPKC